nr:zinc finger, CCHC-type [Tanacetum cinerariifolium]
MALVPKEGGSMSYQVPVLTSTNYSVWAVKVKYIMDAHGLLGTVEPRTLAIGRLKAYEERIKGAEKMEDSQGGLLLASDGKSHGCKHCGGGSSNRDDFGSGRGRGRGSVRGRDGNERVRDKSHVKCYKCGDYGQYNNECPKNEEANLILEELTLF